MLRALRVVLVGTRFPENIGMAARAMANMGASSLVLVRPERWSLDKAAPLATAQGLPILETCRICERLEEALSPCLAAFGTTARTGGWRREVLTPEQAAGQIRALARHCYPEAHEKIDTPAQRQAVVQVEAPGRTRQPPVSDGIALVFGPEDRGLRNTEVELCTRLVNIPTAPGDASLNLAQAVLILLYECMKADLAEPPVTRTGPSWRRPSARADSRLANLCEEALLMRTLEETLVNIGHLPPENPGWFMQPMRRFLRRSRLRRHEFDMIMGICRRIRHRTRLE